MWCQRDATIRWKLITREHCGLLSVNSSHRLNGSTLWEYRRGDSVNRRAHGERDYSFIVLTDTDACVCKFPRCSRDIKRQDVITEVVDQVRARFSDRSRENGNVEALYLENAFVSGERHYLATSAKRATCLKLVKALGTISIERL